VVWIFGAGRTGSTWLMRMMGSLQRYARWSEPMVGELFGSFYSNARKDQLPSRQYILSDLYRESWLRFIRGFVLDGAKARYPGLTAQRYARRVATPLRAVVWPASGYGGLSRHVATIHPPLDHVPVVHLPTSTKLPPEEGM
jgi:hypothetical protein